MQNLHLDKSVNKNAFALCQVRNELVLALILVQVAAVQALSVIVVIL